MKQTSLMCLAALSADVTAAAAAGNGITLAKEGVATACIVIPERASTMERTAATELQQHLRGVTGADFTIHVEPAAPVSGTRLLVGSTRAAGQLLPEFDAAAAPPDTVRIYAAGHDVVLTGHVRRGALYAAFTLLEDIVGVRWWTPTECFLPSRPTLAIPALDITYSPPVIDRSTRYTVFSNGVIARQSKAEKRGHGVTSMAFDEEELREMGVFAARCRLNGPDEYGGPNSLIGWVHTFYSLLPPDRYFDAHPEWYSMIGGTRRHERAQLCLTNEDMRRELVRNALEKLRHTPDATMISVSQNDWNGRCECPECLALEAAEGSPAGPLIHFVNHVAEDIENEFPNVLIETLAYHYTRKPPAHVRPRHNVVIRLCTIECCFAEPLASDPHNQAFRDDIEGWARIAKQLYIWDYTTNFSNYLVPHPNLQVLGPNLRYFAANNAIGVFEQGDSSCRTGDFVRLKAWLLAHLLWNPDANEEDLIEAFMTGYYGAAAAPLTAYLKCIGQAAVTSGVHLNCFRMDTSDWLDLATLNAATELFEQAMAAVSDSPDLCERVRRERLALDHVWLRRYLSLKKQATIRDLPFHGPTDPDAALREFVDTCRTHRVGRIRQGVAFPDDLRAELAPLSLPEAPVPQACRSLRPDQWFELQDADYIPRRRPGLFEIVSDSNASNGFARRMPNTHTVWACHSYPLGSYGVDGSAEWTVSVWVRADAAVDDGDAMRIGIYDNAKRGSVVIRSVAAGTVRGENYVPVELGTHRLTAAMYVWVAPVVRTPEDVSSVLVDRVVLVRKAP
jgi:hypothetical protein